MSIRTISLRLTPILLLLGSVVVAVADHGTASGKSFTLLQSGVTQEIFGVSSHIMGGIAFAPDGDPLVNDCTTGASELHRYDRQGVAPEVFGTKLHPETILPSNAGCGMANHPDGFIYSNTMFGVVRLNATTGVQSGIPFGPAGNALGIATDPQTGDLVYAARTCTFTGTDCDIITANPVTGVSSTFVTVPGFVEGLSFSPDGSQLYLAKRRPSLAVGVIDRTAPGARSGVLNRNIPLSNEPAGIAYHPSGFLLTANVDGTLTKVVPGTPDVVTPFAEDGGRAELTTLGADGCFYVTQDMWTHYDDDTITTQSSLVRICVGGPPPPPGAIKFPIDIEPLICRNVLNVRGRLGLFVAVIGTRSLEVRKIAPQSIKLESVPAAHALILDVTRRLEEGKRSSDCSVRWPDGIPDILLYFEKEPLVKALGPVKDGEVRVLKLTGNLKEQFGGTPITGEDVVVIINKN